MTRTSRAAWKGPYKEQNAAQYSVTAPPTNVTSSKPSRIKTDDDQNERNPQRASTLKGRASAKLPLRVSDTDATKCRIQKNHKRFRNRIRPRTLYHRGILESLIGLKAQSTIQDIIIQIVAPPGLVGAGPFNPRRLHVVCAREAQQICNF